jgi:hypothetical protein
LALGARSYGLLPARYQIPESETSTALRLLLDRLNLSAAASEEVAHVNVHFVRHPMWLTVNFSLVTRKMRWRIAKMQIRNIVMQ